MSDQQISPALSNPCFEIVKYFVKFCINEFPRQYSWKEYPGKKNAHAKNFAYK